MKQTEKMIKGELYNSSIPELQKKKMLEQEILYDFNHLRPSKVAERIRLLYQLFPHMF